MMVEYRPASLGVVCLIPTLNEAPTIDWVVRTATRVADQVVVVDGGSLDDTRRIAEEAGATVLRQRGTGKGRGLRTAFAEIPGEVYVTIDGDATYNPLETSRLIRPILRGAADMVVGSRLQGNMVDGAISRTNIVGNTLFNAIINTVYRAEVSDSQSGFRAVTRRAVEVMRLTANGFDIETEMTVRALQCGLRMTEVPITYAHRTGTPTKLHAVSAGFAILKTLLSSTLAPSGIEGPPNVTPGRSGLVDT